jgi:hypothetical protein
LGGDLNMTEGKQNKPTSYRKLILEKEKMAWVSLKLALGVEKIKKSQKQFQFFSGTTFSMGPK